MEEDAFLKQPTKPNLINNNFSPDSLEDDKIQFWLEFINFSN